MPPLITMPLVSFTSVGSLSSSGTSIIQVIVYPSEEDIESHLWSTQVVLREIISYIESIEYDCECGLSSDVQVLKHNLDNSPKVQQLVELCKDRVVAVFMLGHMLDITTKKIDVEYRNPWEMAVTTYLYVITRARPELTQPAVAAAWRLKNGYWT